MLFSELGSDNLCRLKVTQLQTFVLNPYKAFQKRWLKALRFLRAAGSSNVGTTCWGGRCTSTALRGAGVGGGGGATAFPSQALQSGQ